MSETPTPEVAEKPVDPTRFPETKSAEAWKRKATHDGVTLPSGAVVSIKLPSLEQLVKNNTIPNPLIEAALSHKDADKIDAKMLRETWEYTRFIVPLTVVSPEITEDDVEDLPKEDLQLIAHLAGRQTDTDAVGHQLGGLETLKSFRDLRGIIRLDEALGDFA